MPPPQADAEDMAKLLELIKEYTAKLRTACEDRITDRYRLLTVGMTTMAVLATLVGVMLTFLFKEKDLAASNLSLPLMMGALGASMAAYLAMTSMTSRRRIRSSFDVKYLFATVERLVRTASQYSEHASQRLSDKFTFDIRLAEAEAVLQMYKEMFPQQAEEREYQVVNIHHHGGTVVSGGNISSASGAAE